MFRGIFQIYISYVKSHIYSGRPCGQADHTVLIHSAAGGCGQAALKICSAVGATAVATVGSQSKAAYLIQQYPHILSVETIIVRDSSRFAQQLSAALSSLQVPGFDIVLDAVSGEYFQPGTWLCFATFPPRECNLCPNPMFSEVDAKSSSRHEADKNG